MPSPLFQVLTAHKCVISAGRSGARLGRAASERMRMSVTGNGAVENPGNRTNACR